ncbi:MAG: hypothetical protein QOJ45_824 [Verrucomicrobiota bacterium]
MQKSHPIDAIWQFTLNPLARQRQHPFARVNTLDFHVRMRSKQFGQEPPIPLAHDEDTARVLKFVETRDATTLQNAAERDRFQCPIPRRDGIEAHDAIMRSGMIGVSKTRSARAVR